MKYSFFLAPLMAVSFAGMANAQAVPAPATAAKPAQPAATAPVAPAKHVVSEAGQTEQVNKRIAANFAQADKNHDNKVTPAEAEGVMPAVSKQFDKIDTAKTGSLTLAQITTYFEALRKAKHEQREAKRRERQAERRAGAAPAPAMPASTAKPGANGGK